MLLLRTAYKNIIGGGKRTWLNVAVLSFVLVIMVAYNGILDGWIEEARKDTREWETAEGQYWHPAYDRMDIFSLPDAHGLIPEQLRTDIDKGLATPILAIQASLYPQGRMQNIVLRGIDPKQTVLKLPTPELRQTENDIPAIIGKRMAQSANLHEGDRVMMRWRDKNGVFDAREILITHIFNVNVPGVDAGQIWITLDDLYQMTGMNGEATYIVTTHKKPLTSIEGWELKNQAFLMSDISLMEEGTRMEAAIIFTILLAIALLAVFDTQTLSIFRRQKEIGTYVALGMTPYKVTTLFTLEGTMYSLLAIIAAAVWGSPLLYLFSRTGMPMPDSYSDLGIAIGNALIPSYQVSSILTTIMIVVVMSALISFLPARRIARQNMVQALKGKIS
ncbi:FtsX-like permease family protein [Parabacteroides sp. PF5-9]|uniref:ABC transporter permease n=1 Tax=Parabacteroides sp. PF5-9 TaxID=1742404 RepID=UPI0024765674|nr:FtsX-like permease family protein [Parabacteroides sp. PF5-9]MDH6359266.1 putative ABC transport system permease protein [Parabacteroides sp. PF5-9]